MEGVKAELVPPSNNDLKKIQINLEENIFELINLCLYEDSNKNIDENLILFNPKIKLANYLGNYGGLIAAKIWTNEELTKHIIIDILPKVEAIKTIIEREQGNDLKENYFFGKKIVIGIENILNKFLIKKREEINKIKKSKQFSKYLKIFSCGIVRKDCLEKERIKEKMLKLENEEKFLKTLIEKYSKILNQFQMRSNVNLQQLKAR
uniref:Uncharacterized protein n=1 Tax=Meloidogyne enterolobii TaxID=390850 RepID=A0A6V7V2Q6_MELEN|nr:unnamed protein product [Meloidogyne enterolobii]